MAIDSRVLNISGLDVHVVQKKMKNLRMAVKPPNGEVRISVPYRTPQYHVRDFVLAQWDWIKARQDEIRSRPVARASTYVNGEIHPLWGQSKTLTVIDTLGWDSVVATETSLVMHAKKGSSVAQREHLLSEFYRRQIKTHIPPLIELYAPEMGVKVSFWGVKKMKSRWGTCNISQGRIWLNLVLAKKPPVCLEYVVVHELVHLLESRHNKRFWGLVAHFMPHWQNGHAPLTA
ncbi:MAG: putative metal-dependent hydrolase [Lentisphaeria bacterium]|jgi:predicted metal-dependent hydrolase